MQLVQCTPSEKDLVALSAKSDDQNILLVLNKNPLRRKITIAFDEALVESRMQTDYIAVRNQEPLKHEERTVQGPELDFFAEPFSFNVITLTAEK
jgi:hypothetical protein